MCTSDVGNYGDSSASNYAASHQGEFTNLFISKLMST